MGDFNVAGITRFASVFLAAACIGLAPPAAAWSERGHAALTELAMRQLSVDQRRDLNAVVGTFLEHNPGVAKRTAHLRGLTPVARTAAWLDSLRGQTVEQIFTRYGKAVPAPLHAYAASTTNDWHYSNLLHNEQGQAVCDSADSGELVAVLPKLAAAYQTAESTLDKALSLAMLVHLVGDAHQPLHMLARVETGCEHDRGGNAFCLEHSNSNGRCEENLHRLWDSGAGIFTGRDLEQLVEELARHWPVDAEKLQAFAPSKWQQEALELAEAVYGTEEGSAPSEHYLAKTREVSRRQAALAAARLRSVLEELGE